MRTIATVGGLGYCPVAPGTLGSLVGLGIAWILSGSPFQQGIGCLVVIGLALWSAGPAAREMNGADPKPVVIDEVAGMMVALAALPANRAVYLAGFLLFRLLDILKPGPLRRVEKLPGSWGILLDDLAAGLLTNLMVRFSLLVFR
ncbi:MAG: phosphatidylglycerophosphatase A [Candidatus Omnitrophica bacterium]|nr:phosphatidylglycerophosphatase A [Candidatus Omnitrophota bacterium]